mgnify:CR=1 FL=1
MVIFCTGMFAGISKTIPALSPSHIPWMMLTDVGSEDGIAGSESRCQNVPLMQPWAVRVEAARTLRGMARRANQCVSMRSLIACKTSVSP